MCLLLGAILLMIFIDGRGHDDDTIDEQRQTTETNRDRDRERRRDRNLRLSIPTDSAGKEHYHHLLASMRSRACTQHAHMR